MMETKKTRKISLTTFNAQIATALPQSARKPKHISDQICSKTDWKRRKSTDARPSVYGKHPGWVNQRLHLQRNTVTWVTDANNAGGTLMSRCSICINIYYLSTYLLSSDQNPRFLPQQLQRQELQELQELQVPPHPWGQGHPQQSRLPHLRRNSVALHGGNDLKTVMVWYVCLVDYLAII